MATSHLRRRRDSTQFSDLGWVASYVWTGHNMQVYYQRLCRPKSGGVAGNCNLPTQWRSQGGPRGPPRPPPNRPKKHKLAYKLYEICQLGQLIFEKIIKIVATRSQLLELNCIKFDFGWGSALTPLGELQRSRRPPSWILGDPTSKRREGRGKRENAGKEGRGKKR